MSQPPPTTTATADAEVDVKAMMAEVQQKLAKYDQLEQEISKLTQEQATLESYVTNLMAAKAPPKKRGRQPKATSGSTEHRAAPTTKRAKQEDSSEDESAKPSAAPATKAKHVDSSDDESEAGFEPHHREGTAETEQIPSSPVRRPTEAADVDRSPPGNRAAPVTAKRGTRKVMDDSDSDEEFDQGSESESDYGDKKVSGKGKKAADTGKPKPAAAAKPAASRAKKATAPAAKKAAPTTPVKKTVPVKTATPAIARPALKKSSSSQLGSLLKSPVRPTSPKAARPLLSSPGSSGSLSLQMSPG
ncbi:hypothetical protein FBU31_006321, partial [Coemansia sp. 'formosensis']